MTQKTIEELLDKTRGDSSFEYNSVVNCLAALGDPVSCVVDAINQIMCGRSVNVLAVLIKAEEDYDAEYGDDELFAKVWYYFSGREKTFSPLDDIGDFLMMLAKAFDTGSDNFPKNEETAYKLGCYAAIYYDHFCVIHKT